MKFTLFPLSKKLILLCQWKMRSQGTDVWTYDSLVAAGEGNEASSLTHADTGTQRGLGSQPGL